MKLTQKQLKQIIKEELDLIITENFNVDGFTDDVYEFGAQFDMLPKNLGSMPEEEIINDLSNLMSPRNFLRGTVIFQLVSASEEYPKLKEKIDNVLNHFQVSEKDKATFGPIRKRG
tara:strand:- start:45 stop:392 length:348 start_codon:yes stop_codon:yes gene_type:complete